MVPRISFRKSAAFVGLVMASLLIMSCSARYSMMGSEDRGMEKYAEERYAHALKFMEVGRIELAREQFVLAEKTATSPELKRLAHEGQDKAVAIIEAKR